MTPKEAVATDLKKVLTQTEQTTETIGTDMICTFLGILNCIQRKRFNDPLICNNPEPNFPAPTNKTHLHGLSDSTQLLICFAKFKRLGPFCSQRNMEENQGHLFKLLN